MRKIRTRRKRRVFCWPPTTKARLCVHAAQNARGVGKKHKPQGGRANPGGMCAALGHPARRFDVGSRALAHAPAASKPPAGYSRSHRHGRSAAAPLRKDGDITPAFVPGSSAARINAQGERGISFCWGEVPLPLRGPEGRARPVDRPGWVRGGGAAYATRRSWKRVPSVV